MKMITRRTALIGGGSLIVVSGSVLLAPWFFNRTSVQVPGYPPLEYPGFQTWPTPRDFDGPGTLFSLDKGFFEFQGVLNVSTQLAGDETLPNIERIGSWKGDVLANYIGSANLDAGSTQDIHVSFQPAGAQRWRADPRKIQDALRTTKLPTNTDNAYVITEAISVTSINYDINYGALSSGHLKASAKQDSGVELSAKIQGDGHTLLRATYPHPFFIFFRPLQIRRFQGLGTSDVILLEAEESLIWKQEQLPP